MLFAQLTVVILVRIRLFGATENGRSPGLLRYDAKIIECARTATNRRARLTMQSPKTTVVTESKAEFWSFALPNTSTTEIVNVASTEVPRFRNKRTRDGLSKRGRKKKKHKKGFYAMLKILKKRWPMLMEKMYGPSMFMMGMAQANFNNFVMHALMMSKMALISVIMMIIREMVFGDKDEPVKYYNFGYDDYSPHRRIITSSYTYDYKRRRKRRTLM